MNAEHVNCADMKTILLAMLMLTASASFSQKAKTDILILGSDHLNQIYKPASPGTDVLSPANQASIRKFTEMVMRYKPDVIMIEELPEDQGEIDSLYAVFQQNEAQMLGTQRTEVVQIAFRMGKALKHQKIYCANAPGGTSQSILDNGDNISLYREEGLELRKLVTDKLAALNEGKISMKDYLVFLNQPSTYNKVYKLRYITPARVVNGRFKNPDAMVDTAFINPRYIGAELTSVYKNRDYKIYSNMVTTQMKTGAGKMLLVIGAAHIGSLKSILRDDEQFNLRDATDIIGKQ
jgi:hypothetical protein